MNNILNIGDKLKEDIREFKAEAEIAASELSEVDKELTDIYHFIEFNEFNEKSGLSIIAELQDCLRRRRSIKQANTLVQTLTAGNELTKVVKLIDKAKKDREHAIYVPRVRADLFTKKEEVEVVEEVPTVEEVVNVVEALEPLGMIECVKNKKSVKFNSIQDAVNYIKNRYPKIEHNDTALAKKIDKAINYNCKFGGFVWKKV